MSGATSYTVYRSSKILRPLSRQQEPLFYCHQFRPIYALCVFRLQQECRVAFSELAGKVWISNCCGPTMHFHARVCMMTRHHSPLHYAGCWIWSEGAFLNGGQETHTYHTVSSTIHSNVEGESSGSVLQDKVQDLTHVKCRIFAKGPGLGQPT